MTVTDLRALFEYGWWANGKLFEVLSALQEADLSRTVEFAFGGGPKRVMPVGELLQHAALHGVHHRGQVALLIRTLGRAPENVDLLLYYARPEAGRRP